MEKTQRMHLMVWGQGYEEGEKEKKNGGRKRKGRERIDLAIHDS